MSSLRSKKRLVSRRRLDLKAPAQVKSLSRHLGISPDELTRAAEKVGPSLTAIRKEVQTTNSSAMRLD